MNNVVLSTRNIDDFVIDVANEVIKRIELWNVKPQQKDELLNIDQACTLLGLSKPTLYLFCQKNKIPFSKPSGKKIYFRRDQLLDWATERQEQKEPEFIRRKKSRK